MPNSPVLSGDLSAGGAIPVLQAIEEQRTTGVLRFRAGSTVGEISVLRGQFALEQEETNDGADPVELFLGLHDGTYEVFQRLPPLAISSGTDERRAGSLTVHTPPDLMNYCEEAGLTGMLILECAPHRAEVVYDRGDIVAIRLDGTDDADLRGVFGWTEGGFRIEARAVVPNVDAPHEVGLFADVEPADARVREGLSPGSRVVEVALSSIIQERDNRRPPSERVGALAPSTDKRTHDSVLAALPLRRSSHPPDPATQKVRVVYLGSVEGRALGDGMRHVVVGLTSEASLPEARPERMRGRTASRPSMDAVAPPAGKVSVAERANEPVASTGAVANASTSDGGENAPTLVVPRPTARKSSARRWALVACGLALALLLAFAVLALLPALE